MLAYATLMYQSNRSLMILPGHLNFWPVIECLNSPLQGLKAIQVPHSLSVSGDQIPTPKILFVTIIYLFRSFMQGRYLSLFHESHIFFCYSTSFI